MKKRNVALGFYQEPATARAVISELKKKNFFRFATIFHKHDHSFEINRYFIGSEVVNRFKDRVIVDEILIIVSVKQSEVRDVLAILRQVKSGHPVTFLLRPPMFEERNVEIHFEPLTLDSLRQEASKLAPSLEKVETNGYDHQLLMKRFQQSSKTLQFLRQDVADAEYIEQTVPSSAEWLLDNMYVVEGSIEDVKNNLTKKYYKQLPKIVDGPLKGFPRIYGLAVEIVKNTAGTLNRENVIHFLEGYQLHHPLTIGELWAFPLMLRLRLVEWVEALGVRVDNRMREGELASFWGNRFLYAARHEPSKLPQLSADLSREAATYSGHFAEELLDHLFDEEALLEMVRGWVEKRFALPLAELLHQEHLEETSEQLVFSNCIKSLITLSQLSWPDIFEIVSPVDAILKEDIIYEKMDFTTRNRYRESIEQIARHTHLPEIEVAKQTLLLAQIGVKEFEQHIGYYLIDSGREVLEQNLGYQPTFIQSIQRWIFEHASLVYIGGTLLFICALEAIALQFLLNTESSNYIIILFLFLSLLPISELSIQILNLLLMLILPTSLRPKMLFKEGIPQEYKTLVVVPMMLLTPDSIQEEIDRLEIRYLANTDPFLYFGLFSDFSDSKQQHLEQDSYLLNLVIDGLKTLENKYGPNKFFLFHRKRSWSQSENAWIGWERKRGKLHYLNQFLSGETLPENIVYMGNSEALKGIHYVITLDSDTQLPKDQARALIEVISHPLNRPYLNANKDELERGYTIIQPRVGTDFVHSRVSRFCQIFSEPAVVDPYTQAIANIYQDLTGEGSYYGKGIYDLATFHHLLSHHLPEEHLLSHDLLEGAFVRVGYASNICLFDMHPKDYLSWSHRQHRWMRGDWQIVDWLTAKVPTATGEKEKNRLSWLNRWKIFDNLRRALLPISLMLLLIFAWTISAAPLIWTKLATIILILPFIILCATRLYSFYTIKLLFNELKTLVFRILIITALLPYEASLSFNALIRVIYRRLISHRHLLQWTVSEYDFKKESALHQRLILQLGIISLFAVGILGIVIISNYDAGLIALPFCLLWAAAPLIVHVIDKPLDKPITKVISQEDQKALRKIARKTWRYFDELIGPETHWLPPDNYQTALNIEVAKRTSPTNIGMWLMSLMSAYDFKYITCDFFIDKAFATIEQLKNLERYEGNFLNWYNTESLEPLFPRYVSFVDSGNLLASFWTLSQGAEAIKTAPIIPKDALSGLQDTCAIALHARKSVKIEQIDSLLNASVSQDLSSFIAKIKNSLEILRKPSDEGIETYWIEQIEAQLNEWNSIISRYFTWVDVLSAISLNQLQSIDSLALTWKEQVLAWEPSLEMLSSNHFPQGLHHLIEASQKNELPQEIKEWNRKLKEGLSTAQWFVGEKLGVVEKLNKEIDQFSQEMNLGFLYSKDRKLFTIGYNVDDHRLDSSFYDLLASEARIGSLIAIAKEDAPLEHWWALGRFYNLVEGQKVLLSWGGTMFEYLMPLIFNKQFPDSLLGEACYAAVACQTAYGKKRGIPWGISESAFSAIDSHKIYQYKSFGTPGLGLKRGLEKDLVVSPYSSALALAVDPQSAINNLKKMAHAHLIGDYGYYESIDFTRQKSPSGDRGVIVYVYMAHHQGMILSSINNTLNDDALIKRFQKDPRISGVSSLLYERLPFSPPIKLTSNRKEPSLRRLEPFSQSPIMGVVETPESVTPKINLLSNEKYSLMITNTGGGYSRFGDIEIYRWRADTTRDYWGNFYYIKDLKSGEIWSATYQPTQTKGTGYSVNFKGDKSEFRRKDHQIETFTEVIVSPEDNAEIRLITLINHSKETRYLELTSYLELSLAPHLTDSAHPCFNKLFIETEALPESFALLGFRRLRSPEDSPLFAFHVLSTNTQDGNVQYETDRNRFIGRGKSLKSPAALEGDLSNTTGTVLDPIFSLRSRVVLEPERRVQISFVTGITDNRSSALALIEKYKDIAASYRALELAWTYAQLELRYLRIHQEEVQLFQKLASRIIYPHVQLRTAGERIRKNRLGQSSLWPHGISGDLPIVAVTVGDLYDVDVVKQLLIAHAFWNLRGLKVDLVILNEEEMGYEQPLQEHLQRLIQAYSFRTQIDTPGGVFLRSSSLIPPDELNLILCVARAVLVASRGTLRQQLISPKPRVPYSPKLRINEKATDEPSRPLPFLELPYFNGLGGFTPDGCSYVIYLGPHTNTPAPWINVLANSQFGILVSESGLGCSWYGNSQTNRLTPWSNDPLLDPIADAIYIRDEELGTVWTPTPAPIRELDAYRITHSQGYTQFEHNSHGIKQELLVFVPVNDRDGLPLRIQRLRLTNQSSRRRSLSLTTYSEWILGRDKEDTEMHLVTEWDAESQALFIYNHYNPNFGNYVGFSSVSMPIASFTGDRTEFLGRNQSPSSPEALQRKKLSGNAGPAFDPCSALQVEVEIEPGQQIEVIFTLGYASDVVKARELVCLSKNKESVDQLLSETISWWNKTLQTIQVDVPDKATNFLMNRWLVYQSLSCRFWGRTAFYQSSGAYGFRDQLQDTMTVVYSLPTIAREYILKAASRQFIEGDVQHWWHEQTGAGVRTRCSDDLLWLPFVTAHYVKVTGDASILKENVPFLESDLLTDDQHEVFQIPSISKEEGSLLEHCRRAIKKGTTAGPHGLPLIGSGDWNDGMNRVGIHGKGESVWLAWFLICVLNDFAELLDQESADVYRKEAKHLAEVVEKTAWDGDWYRRAYFDDETPLGSKQNMEASIDSLTQSWAIISGLADPERSALALRSAEESLVKAKENIVLLLTPPFDKTPNDPGYIKGYPPGVRENGGQYTHGSSWLAMAFARSGNGTKAVELLKMLSPTPHTPNEQANMLYKVEPFVITADIYDLKNQVGRGGWSWYTGSASWIYRIWLEEVLGFKLRGQTLTFNCSIPKEWDGFKLQYRYKSSLYEITVENPHHLNSGKTTVTLDGVTLASSEIFLVDDGGHHKVSIVLKTKEA